jgi:hypothetical protein
MSRAKVNPWMSESVDVWKAATKSALYNYFVSSSFILPSVSQATGYEAKRPLSTDVGVGGSRGAPTDELCFFAAATGTTAFMWGLSHMFGSIATTSSTTHHDSKHLSSPFGFDLV